MDKPVKIPFINSLLTSPKSGEDIEAMSFSIIDKEVYANKFTNEEWNIVRRMIHTSADFSLLSDIRFSDTAIFEGIKALQDTRPIYVDSNMIRSGLSIARLQKASQGYSAEKIMCHIADPDVAIKANNAGLPRSLFAIRKAKHRLNGAIIVFGNAPVALLELNRMIIEEGIKPALVIGMPVGFVHVEESKEELMQLDVPYIVLSGRRGGSTLAVSVVHALCSLAPQSSHQNTYKNDNGNTAIILLGHGSRQPGAAQDMEQVARSMTERLGGGVIETCSMSMLGPHFSEVFDKCVSMGATKIIVIPYFLHVGVHMREDIPEMLKKKVEEFPHVKLILGKNLGYDECLVDLVIKRVEESSNLVDIRALRDFENKQGE